MIRKERNPNIFANWQHDTMEVIETCCKCDFEYWKVQNFIKDASEIDNIKQLVRKYYTFLNEVFINLSIKSLAYPNCSQIEFGNLIAACGILDAKFTQGICDTQFIASKVDVDKRNFKTFG